MSTCSLSRSDNSIGVMWKTVSESCNLACDYCYYSRCNGKPKKNDIIAEDVLEKFIQEYMALSNGAVSFAWQGGEPLLAGFDFFKRVVYLQAKYAPRNTIIANSIQTNGTLINKEWAAFFKQYNFLVGISLDGPKHINDARRTTGSGKGSFESVMKGINYLKENNVDFNILTVIHEGNVSKSKELMDFYQLEGFRHIQFIPCMDFQSHEVDKPGNYLITPKQYGDFLCNIFDVWYNDGHPTISIRFFDNLLANYLNREPELCTHRKECPKMVVFEKNGDAYPCDFFLHEDFRLGNIKEDRFLDILDNKTYDHFLKNKASLPGECKKCDFLHLCYGGCPRNRNGSLIVQESDVDYFCESYKKIYSYAHERMEIVARNLKRKWLDEYKEKSGKFPNRNDICLCGSKLKFKKCCGQ
ncbi:anaerobic sulfatase maturase [Bacillus shivajii]|uniref:anaerobic sulfatase maturase n=1 Tax=Bacillus shivajii TaxID=1983719 RepID=UPI001CF9ACF3|nr:anaerobic sulfatase maturase [Bacillus shivajii]UCZ52490.1 anaerobic sulfatase maturase [Bacillus shivajii]